MLKLLKYLKRSVIPILIIVLLLVFQAMCDLALPDYTSDIVNVGIQQGGVEDTVPTVIRQSSLTELEEVILPEDLPVVEESYSMISREDLSEQEYQKDVKKYPALENEPLYLLHDSVTNQTRSDLNRIFGDAFLTETVLNSDNPTVTAAKQQIISGLPVQQQAEAESLSLNDLILSIPNESRVKFQQSINRQIEEYGDMTITQLAAPMVLSEYEAIGMDVDSMQMHYLLIAGVQMLLIALCSLTAVVLVTLLSSRVAASFGQELRSRTFRQVLQFSGKEMDQFSTASLITRSTNDVQQIQLLMPMLLRIVFYAPIIAIGGIIKVMSTQISLLWVIALAVLAIFSVVAVLFLFALPKFNIIQSLIDKLNLVMREILTGLPVIRAFSTQKQERKRFDDANAELTKINLFVNRMMACMMPAMMFIMNASAILIVWVGGHGVDAGTMQVGNMMAVIQYSMQIIISFLMISIISIMLPRASVAADRIAEVLNTQVSIQDPENPKSFDENQKGVVAFEHVSFRYPGAEENVLTDINFVAKPGETTALIGSTGSGKSTLINLIPRFYDVSEGRVLVDGADVRDVTLYDLRARLGYVPQKGILFSGTIEENIAYGKDGLPSEQVKAAATIAQATEFIESKPMKYQSEVAQGGSNVSGGQRQRLSIARAISGSPEIYIFDDSFSALDYKTDRMLRKELKQATSNATVLIVAQRISTIMHAEKILVIDEGLIVGQGTHSELLKNCPIYREIAESQLSKEELEHA